MWTSIKGPSSDLSRSRPRVLHLSVHATRSDSTLLHQGFAAADLGALSVQPRAALRCSRRVADSADMGGLDQPPRPGLQEETSGHSQEHPTASPGRDRSGRALQYRAPVVALKFSKGTRGGKRRSPMYRCRFGFLSKNRRRRSYLAMKSSSGGSPR